MKYTECLCARRQNLHVFLINKRFYAEASEVFYAWNNFAFEDTALLNGFLMNIRAANRKRIWAITFIMPTLPDTGRTDWSGWPKCPPMWNILAECTGLYYLELDAIFLTKPALVKQMRQLPQAHLVMFSRRDIRGPSFPIGSLVFGTASETYIEPLLAVRKIMNYEDRFTFEFAASVGSGDAMTVEEIDWWFERQKKKEAARELGRMKPRTS